MIGIERHQESAEIRNVLTQSLPPIDVQSGQDFIAIELMRQLPRPLLELLVIDGSPPVTQSPARVDFAALIVKAVSDFVANDRSDRPVVVRGIRFRIKERRLQDSRRKNDEIF